MNLPALFCEGMCRYGILASFPAAGKFCEIILGLRHAASVIALDMRNDVFLFPKSTDDNDMHICPSHYVWTNLCHLFTGQKPFAALVVVVTAFRCALDMASEKSEELLAHEMFYQLFCLTVHFVGTVKYSSSSTAWQSASVGWLWMVTREHIAGMENSGGRVMESEFCSYGLTNNVWYCWAECVVYLVNTQIHSINLS